MKKTIVGILCSIVAIGLNAWSPTTIAQPKETSKTTERHTAMKFNNFVYIFLGPELDPKVNRSVVKTENFTFTAVGIDFHHKEQVLEVAKEAVASGAQIIELCGGFGPLWIAKVTDAINGQVPVGSVAYGPEARKPLIDLLS